MLAIWGWRRLDSTRHPWQSKVMPCNVVWVAVWYGIEGRDQALDVVRITAVLWHRLGHWIALILVQYYTYNSTPIS